MYCCSNRMQSISVFSFLKTHIRSFTQYYYTFDLSWLSCTWRLRKIIIIIIIIRVVIDSNLRTRVHILCTGNRKISFSSCYINNNLNKFHSFIHKTRFVKVSSKFACFGEKCENPFTEVYIYLILNFSFDKI